ncbi:hypothetical protein BDA96_02G180700 [Sorghum bicolor]|uniref:Uncharacterized protein n=2 Tax=Sorghum bicolor TaxID=4558 RepID=A0A921RMM4_SORBI|nr:hypothetical protein BDA96_02G180700 [Sorghum bicolor]KXG35433.2 hypothetical protein SORBI_3002G171901 [Sorghum bicolor]
MSEEGQSASEDATLGFGPQVGEVGGVMPGLGGAARRGWWRACAAEEPARVRDASASLGPSRRRGSFLQDPFL